MKKITAENLVYVSLIILAVGSRLVVHSWNFTAVMAASLAFAMLYKQAKTKAVFLPIIAMFISDLILGFHSTIHFVYLGFALALVPALVLKPSVWSARMATVLAGSLVFFVVSNLGVWLMDGLYPMTLDGFINCYVAAIPFFKNQLMADIMLTPVLFVAISKFYAALPETGPGTVRS